jgi:hypothetical protein
MASMPIHALHHYLLTSSVGPYMLHKRHGACLPFEASLVCGAPKQLRHDTIVSTDSPLRQPLGLVLLAQLPRLIAL